jgi:hypothetical protein
MKLQHCCSAGGYTLCGISITQSFVFSLFSSLSPYAHIRLGVLGLFNYEILDGWACYEEKSWGRSGPKEHLLSQWLLFAAVSQSASEFPTP